MIQEFLNYQQNNKGLSAETVHGYRKELRAFVRWAQPLGMRWSTVTADVMNQYVANEHARGMSPRTIKRRVEVLRLFFSHLMHKGVIDVNPAQYTQVPKVREELPKTADADALRSYLNSTPLTRQGWLIHYVITLIMETGMRISEVVKMRGTDIDLGNRTILVRGKGGKDRYVIYGQGFEKFARMAANRKDTIIKETEERIRYMMYEELGFSHVATPHSIRHLFACEQLNKGMDIKTLATLMGHKNVSTTEIYARMTKERLANMYNNINN